MSIFLARVTLVYYNSYKYLLLSGKLFVRTCVSGNIKCGAVTGGRDESPLSVVGHA